MRITQAILEAKVCYLNELTGNNKSIRTRIGQKLQSNVGNYHVSYAYGGVSLHQICNDSGGVDDIFNMGHMTKRDLFYMINAYTKGIQSK